MSKIAVVLFNLGGPDSPEAVRPFLQNLFSDPAIIGAPRPIRWLLARLISRRRAPIAREIYAQIGGRSPILELTAQQAEALRIALSDAGDVRCFIAMRYWKPFADETAAAVKAFDPDRILLLPLYPQFSTTTSGSSLKDWQRAAGAAGLTQPTMAICCYPTDGGFIAAQARLLNAAIDKALPHGRPRVLFSAHGLPKRVIDGGDPYKWQVEQTADAVARLVGRSDYDWLVSYQSRVGPLEWIRPYTEDEIRRAGSDRVPLIVLPVAFVSEHSETLVELDIEYRELAEESGVPLYLRVPAVATDPAFIEGLATLVRRRLTERTAADVAGPEGTRICPGACTRCAMA